MLVSVAGPEPVSVAGPDPVPVVASFLEQTEVVWAQIVVESCQTPGCSVQQSQSPDPVSVV